MPSLPQLDGPILDCSSTQTAIDSFARILGTDRETVRLVAERVLVQYEGAAMAPENQIAIQMGINIDDPPCGYQVRWFHATRVPRTEDFSEGLLPTPQALPKIWSALGTLAIRWLTETEWRHYQRSFLGGKRHYSQQYRIKRMVKGWEGPFAFSNRDAATGRHGRVHRRYTGIGETAADICADFHEVFGHDLGTAYAELAQPCLVVFVWPAVSLSALKAAANFIFRDIIGMEHGRDCNAVFRGGGRVVPAQMIEKVDWLEPEG